MKRKAKLPLDSSRERKFLNSPAPNHRAQFIALRDSRNRRIPGLYVRGGGY
ncbi:MAG: hypothetical protein ACREFG_02660 [Chthoniobacterales bacterium]